MEGFGVDSIAARDSLRLYWPVVMAWRDCKREIDDYDPISITVSGLSLPRLKNVNAMDRRLRRA